jgi:hypothetical protein
LAANRNTLLTLPLLACEQAGADSNRIVAGLDLLADLVRELLTLLQVSLYLAAVAQIVTNHGLHLGR